MNTEEVIMNKNEFITYITSSVRLLDGAFGTELQKNGMEPGACPEQWCLAHPDIAKKIQASYAAAGSDIILAPTFGANAIKLRDTPLASDVIGTNQKLVHMAREAAPSGVLVAGDVSPLGVLLDPMGTYSFEACVAIYKEQIRGITKSGEADLICLETFIDVEEARAAAIAAQEVCDLPVTVSFAFDENHRLLTGADAVTALYIMADLGVCAFGINCGSGPAYALDTIKLVRPHANIPLIAKPNAGLPETDEQGRVFFHLSVTEFCSYAAALVENGVCLIGGCCGTSPDYIRALKAEVSNLSVHVPDAKPHPCLCSSRQTVFIDEATTYSAPISIDARDIDDILDDILDDESDVIVLSSSAAELDVEEIIRTITQMVRKPLSFSFDSRELTQRAQRVYCGISNQ